jgi:hypothetical protein
MNLTKLNATELNSKLGQNFLNRHYATATNHVPYEQRFGRHCVKANDVSPSR